MKRITKLGLVVILTIMSVFAMITVNRTNIQEESVFVEDGEDDYGKPDGTGYMFEDYGKGINIPFEEEKVKEEENAKPNIDNKSSQLEQEKFKRVLERNMARIEESQTSSGISNKSNIITHNSVNIRDKSKSIINKVKNNISFEEKLYLLKVVSSLSLSELKDIKNAIMNGTTNAESIKLWTMLRNKLPNDEYKKLENIIAKYE